MHAEPRWHAEFVVNITRRGRVIASVRQTIPHRKRLASLFFETHDLRNPQDDSATAAYRILNSATRSTAVRRSDSRPSSMACNRHAESHRAFRANARPIPRIDPLANNCVNRSAGHRVVLNPCFSPGTRLRRSLGGFKFRLQPLILGTPCLHCLPRIVLCVCPVLVVLRLGNDP